MTPQAFAPARPIRSARIAAHPAMGFGKAGPPLDLAGARYQFSEHAGGGFFACSDRFSGWVDVDALRPGGPSQFFLQTGKS